MAMFMILSYLRSDSKITWYLVTTYSAVPSTILGDLEELFNEDYLSPALRNHVDDIDQSKIFFDTGDYLMAEEGDTLMDMIKASL